MKNAEIKRFQKTVWDFYKKEGRHNLPWRKTKDPYKILVSEVMLQQTQVDRVIPKYKAFLKQFPNVVSLAKGSNVEVLKIWSGLGYNRRALYLKRAVEAIVSDFGGKFPKDAESLETLPGIGPYTARAIATFSFGASYVFIETNIRAAFIHGFFPRSKLVSDTKLSPYIEKTLDAGRSREWYFALMDYGAHLKKTLPNPSRRSVHHTKQAKFEGSLRQMRGALLRAVLAGKYKKGDKPELERALPGMVKDGILDVDQKGYVNIKK